jgi:hypothetical protein
MGKRIVIDPLSESCWGAPWELEMLPFPAIEIRWTISPAVTQETESQAMVAGQISGP